MADKKNYWQLLDFNFYIIELVIRKEYCENYNEVSVWISETRLMFTNLRKVGWRKGITEQTSYLGIREGPWKGSQPSRTTWGGCVCVRVCVCVCMYIYERLKVNQRRRQRDRKKETEREPRMIHSSAQAKGKNNNLRYLGITRQRELIWLLLWYQRQRRASERGMEDLVDGYKYKKHLPAVKSIWQSPYKIIDFSSFLSLWVLTPFHGNILRLVPCSLYIYI